MMIIIINNNSNDDDNYNNDKNNNDNDNSRGYAHAAALEGASGSSYHVEIHPKSATIQQNQ